MKSKKKDKLFLLLKKKKKPTCKTKQAFLKIMKPEKTLQVTFKLTAMLAHSAEYEYFFNKKSVLKHKW